MKLLLCIKCDDIFKLDYSVRTCKCGYTQGYLESDGLNAVVTEDATILGFNIHSLAWAVKQQHNPLVGTRFDAFIISPQASTITVTSEDIIDVT